MVDLIVQRPHHWIGHEKLPQNDPSYVIICPVVPKLWKGLLPSQLICTVTSPLDRAWKTIPKWPLICYNLPIGSKFMERSSSMSADLYSGLTIGLDMKNYPKLTPHMQQSTHWFQSYGKVFFHVSCTVLYYSVQHVTSIADTHLL